MKVLLSNDDGIAAEGLHALAAAFSVRHQVVICAPMREQSGMSHALTVHRPMEIVRRKDLERLYHAKAWALDGTPTDCVKIYLEAIAGEEQQPDVVVSGINHGANLATDVLYSGTVGAAMEGSLHGVHSLAVSLDRNSELSYEQTAELTVDYAEKLIREANEQIFFNINFPRRLRRGRAEFVFTKLGKRDYINAFTQHTDEQGRTYYTVGGDIYDTDCSEATDIYAVESGYVAVTPLHTELTDYVALENVLGRA